MEKSFVLKGNKKVNLDVVGGDDHFYFDGEHDFQIAQGCQYNIIVDILVDGQVYKTIECSSVKLFIEYVPIENELFEKVFTITYE